MSIAIKYIIYCISLLLTLPCLGQWQVARLDSTSLLQIETIPTPAGYDRSAAPKHGQYPLKAGYPLTFEAHAIYKNFRNVTLSDLDEDGADETIFAVADRMYVYDDTLLQWTTPLSGLARFPVAIDDIDQDGRLDIAVLTGFSDEPGRIYVFDREGQFLPGWPKSFGGRWNISSPVLADLDGDGIREIVSCDLDGSRGHVMILTYEGHSFSNQWPQLLPNIPAVTPSVGDVDQDGHRDIVIQTTREIYVLDRQGDPLPGWPFNNGFTKYSFQSPIIANLDDDATLEIVATGHGERPLYQVFDHRGGYQEGWPHVVQDNRWTFHPPTVIEYGDRRIIITARPLSGNAPQAMMYAWYADGELLDGFPIVKAGGCEGVVTVADLTDDGRPELIFPSNMIDERGYGTIHAYSLADPQAEIDGFPLRMKGWTFLNGATMGDVDGDGLLDLAVLTYTEYVDDTPDTAFLWVYETSTPSLSSHVWWPTYKGSNTRDGNVESITVSTQHTGKRYSMQVVPNPASNYLRITFDGIQTQRKGELSMVDMYGRSHKRVPDQEGRVAVGGLPAGVYLLRVRDVINNILYTQKIVIQ